MKRSNPNKMILKRHYIVRSRDLNPRDDDDDDDDNDDGMIVEHVPFTRYCSSQHP